MTKQEGVETVTVSQAPVVSGSSAPVSPLFVRRAVAAFLPAVLDLARSFLRPGGICFSRSGCGLGGHDCSCFWRVGSAVPFSLRCGSSHW